MFAVSLGAGHVWRTEGIASSTCVDFIVCVHCGRRLSAPTMRMTRIMREPKRGKSYAFSSARLHGGRPLGTCSAGSHTAQRRAKGEAEIRATFDLFK